MATSGGSGGRAAEEEASSSKGVRFGTEEEDDKLHDNKIKVVPSVPGKAIVHCGLLKVHHRYHLTFNIPKNLLPRSQNVTVEISEPPNPNCRLLNIADSADTDTDVSLTVDLTAHKEKLQKETVTLVDGGNAANRTTFILQARVLGRGKGTPMLKDGVQMVEALPNPDDTDVASDWKGF